MSILGRVRFTPRSEPAIDWSETESGLREISAPFNFSHLPSEPSATLANDPPGSASGDFILLLPSHQDDLHSEISPADPRGVAPDPKDLLVMADRRGSARFARHVQQTLSELQTPICSLDQGRPSAVFAVGLQAFKSE